MNRYVLRITRDHHDGPSLAFRVHCEEGGGKMIQGYLKLTVRITPRGAIGPKSAGGMRSGKPKPRNINGGHAVPTIVGHGTCTAFRRLAYGWQNGNAHEYAG
jgi:hypothetical protein